jgi:hypothetical protein
MPVKNRDMPERGELDAVDAIISDDRRGILVDH